MEAYQQRVVDELNQLHERRAKLGEFLRSPELSKVTEPEQKLLQEQHDVMAQYETILDRRIAIFKGREPRRPGDGE
jgi:hypothetical protein